MKNEVEFDKTVGRIAGGIFSDLSATFRVPPLMLVPALTFKVRRVLENLTDLRLLSDHQRRELASEIRVSVVPMLFSYEMDAADVEKMAPLVETAALRMINEEVL